MPNTKHEHSWMLVTTPAFEIVAYCRHCKKISENYTVSLPCIVCGKHVFSLTQELCADCLYDSIAQGEKLP